MTKKISSFSKGFASFVQTVIGLVLLVLVGVYLNFLFSSQAAMTNKQQPAPSPVVPESTVIAAQGSTTETYVDNSGHYSLTYPKGYTSYPNQNLSSQGVKVPAADTFTLLSSVLPSANTNFKLSISHTSASSGTLLEQAVDSNGWCIYLSHDKGKSYTLGGKPALIFEDSPCGPTRSTVIYALNNNTIYTLSIETMTSFGKIRANVDPILASFRFLP